MADCNNCPSKGDCDSQESCSIKNNEFSNVKRVIGVMSGKGGRRQIYDKRPYCKAAQTDGI